MSALSTISPVRLGYLALGALALTTIGVFAFSDTLRLPVLPDGYDKELHVAAFCVCGFILMLGARRSAMVITGLMLSGVAIGVEWAQPIFTATREASAADAAASILGVFLGAGAALAANTLVRWAPAKARAR